MALVLELVSSIIGTTCQDDIGILSYKHDVKMNLECQLVILVVDIGDYIEIIG